MKLMNNLNAFINRIYLFSIFQLPKDTLDPYYTVIAFVLDGPIRLYSDQNGAVEQH